MKVKAQGRSVTLSKEQVDMFNALTKLQQNFVLKKLEGLSNYQSYVAAGGKSKTQEAASVSAIQILHNINVSSFIKSFDEIAVERIASAVMSREEMIERLSTMARVKVDDVLNISNRTLYDSDGEEVAQGAWSLKNVEDMTNDAAIAISELTAGKDGLKVKLHNQIAAMKQLADLCGYNKPQEINLNGNLSVELTNTQKGLLDKALDGEY
ncbi:small subunit terminase TerS [Iodobacter phage PhiPLPE]|uniref:Small subunit terminase TerS n=1 Tax=Iodobacter phage PhiPLPE TaxID=551895 RepID=B5AX36_9CAUD|nr:small subunit terminase TerS [Iodobacter phage PhiPLPE]ACG60339.1 small subunit terminase TerS [Iodobacter phage PhiPLPE]